MAKTLKVYEVTLSNKEGGSFMFVVVAKNKERATAISKPYKRKYGYNRMKVKYSGLNKMPYWQGLPDTEGVY